MPFVRRALARNWPAHPLVRFLSDGGIDPGADVYIEAEPRFVPLLARGLARLRGEMPGVTHVFHMLEDHCPLRPCDASRLLAIFGICGRHDLAAMAFPTYPWPWSETEDRAYADGLIRTWRKIDLVDFDGETFARVPKDFFRYFQVQPTLWSIDYLAEACSRAMAAGATDPWKFEALRMEGARQHYVSKLQWPTVHHGFLVQGTVNACAIEYAEGGSHDGLRRELIKEYTGVGGEWLYQGVAAARKFYRRLKDIAPRQ